LLADFLTTYYVDAVVRTTVQPKTNKNWIGASAAKDYNPNTQINAHKSPNHYRSPK